MPKLARISDWIDAPIPRTVEYLRASKKQTRQGVKDLNGPLLNGRGYNGHKSATCAHHRAQAITPKHVIEKTVPIASAPGLDLQRITCCSLCGSELYVNE